MSVLNLSVAVGTPTFSQGTFMTAQQFNIFNISKICDNYKLPTFMITIYKIFQKIKNMQLKYIAPNDVGKPGHIRTVFINPSYFFKYYNFEICGALKCQQILN